MGQMKTEPFLALTQSLRVRQHHLDAVQRRRLAQQVVAYQEAHLANDMNRGAQKQIK